MNRVVLRGFRATTGSSLGSFAWPFTVINRVLVGEIVHTFIRRRHTLVNILRSRFLADAQSRIVTGFQLASYVRPTRTTFNIRSNN